MDETRDGHDTPSDPPPETAPSDPPPETAPSDPAPVTVVAAVHEQPRPERPRRTRRWVLAGAAAVVVGGAAGVAADFARGRSGSRHRDESLPAALRAALADERALLASTRVAHGLPTGVREALLRDHEAHLAALTAATAGFTAPKRATAAPASTTTPATAPNRAGLRRLETRAALQAGRRAEHLADDTAALLASISACESTHAELLS